MREIQNLQSFNLDQLPREVRAHILQAIQDLTGFAMPQSMIGVLIKTIGPMPQDTTEFKPDFTKLPKPIPGEPWRIAIQVSSEDFHIEQEAEHADIFIAVSEAKDRMMGALGKIHSQIPVAENSTQAVSVSLKPETIH